MQVSSTRWQHVSSGKPSATCSVSLGPGKRGFPGGFHPAPSLTDGETEVQEGGVPSPTHTLCLSCRAQWPLLLPQPLAQQTETCMHTRTRIHADLTVWGSFPILPTPWLAWSPSGRDGVR